MPSFADTFVANDLKSVADSRDPNAGSGIAQGMQVGANLAIEQQKLQMQQREMQQKQQQFKQAQTQKLYDYISNAKNYQNAGDRQNFLKSAIGYRNAMGMDQSVAPDSAILSLGSDENMGRMYTLQEQVANKSLSVDDAIDLATNPLKRDAFSKIMPTPLEMMGKRPDLNEAQKEVLDRTSREKVAAEKSDVFSERNIVSQHENALKEISAPNSKVQKALGSAQAITNAYKAFEASGGMGAEFEQFQNQLRLNQGSSAAARSGVAERAKAHATSIGISAQQYIQLATGQVQDVGLSSPDLVRAMKEVGKIETQQITKQADDALNSAVSGRKGFYQKVGGYKADDYSARVQETRDQLKSLNSDYGGGGEDMVKVGNKPFPRKVLEKYVNDPSNASHPDYAAAKAALGVK